MRTDAPSNVTENYLKRGKKPRVYVYIPDLDLFMGTVGATIDGEVYGNRLSGAGTITWDAPMAGGIATVSNVTIDNLELDRDIELASEAEQEPLPQNGQIGAGRIIKESPTTGGTYADSRGSATGEFSTSSIIIGRAYRLYGGADRYSVARGLLQHALPAGLTSCEEAYISLDGIDKDTLNGVELYVVERTWQAWATADLFDGFDGHESGMTQYTGTILNERWHSDEFIAGGENKIRLNEHGRKYIEEQAAAGQAAYFTILSKADYDGDAGSYDNDQVRFEATTATLNLKYNTLELTNREAQIYYGYDPLPSALGDIFLRWTGVIHSYEISDKTLSLELRQAKNKHNRYIPDKQISKADYPECPDVNVGKTYPLVIGEFAATTLHKTGVGNFTAYGPITSLINYSYPDCYKAYVVKDAVEEKLALLSEKRVVNHSQPFFVWNGAISAFELFHILTTIIVPLGISEQTLTPRTETSGFPHSLSELQFKALSTIIPSKHVVNGLGITDPEGAYDEDSDTYCSISQDNASLDFYFTRPEGISGTGAIAFLVYAKFIGGADPTDFHFLLVKDQRTSVSDPNDWVQIADTATWTGDGLYLFGFYIIDANSKDRQQIPLDQYRMTLYRDTDDTGEVQVYDVCAVLAYNAEDITELFTYGQGLPYGSWVDASGRSNAYDQSDVVENPPMIVEALSREYMELTSSEIDTSAIDTASGELASWKMAYDLLEMTPSMTHFGEIGEQSKSLVTFDEQNRLTIITHDADRAFPGAGTNTPWKPGELDIFDEAAGLTNGAFTRHPIEPGSFTVEPYGEPRNNFKLRYKYNYATNQYEGLLYINHGGGVAANVDSNIDVNNLEDGMTLTGTGGLKDLTSSCYNRILTVKTKIIECPYIRDEATATKELQHEVIMHATDRHIAKFRTYDNAILHELWDYINIRHRRLLTFMDQARMEQQKWRVLRIQHAQMAAKIGITAIEE